MVTALLFETKEQEESWLGRGIEGNRSPYPLPQANTAPFSHAPNPLRVRLEFLMAEQERLGAELQALAEHRWSRKASRRKKELTRALKDLESEQGSLVEEAKRQLLRQAQ
ncbi:hypothetical protein COCSUDRAFT_38187 [Coccomyxa subellipsoidea C-169]|uniref:Uncharacterized protein n=1 Tax=Coccomyxa subellipsoidea (strain C-169) TaxID=574566 RepID=I0YLI9_COCSC|nr:hypothetical protein COCSUDRAFT_38187 [Coccomyxa subellipsoidea C-169]EIE19258.1 hypothetical protein COCSUDRAFT_38187 [Coccomyxa subellipsoidea C-169]|eukprot:XP_005643802.1 hypothetical protein COCSUDRAFT_38187 [Coccomyxa subellipsoidea C-169]